MSALRTDYFPASNRRRCVTGRSSYTETSDLCLSAAVSQDQNSNGFSQNEDSCIDSIQSDDGEEEDITIDLSAFLNDNPLLAQAAFESASENNVAPAESSSQFRVTDCKVDPSEIPKAGVTDPLLSADVNGDTSVVNNIADENNVGTHAADAHTLIQNNVKENCLNSEKILINVTNSEPAQNLTLNGKKTLSPTKKFSKALGLSNPLKKYKNFMKSKDLNKVNEKVFGKYPIVKCEKLDIENFVKNNKIKIRNWPLLHADSKKSNSINKNTIRRKVNVNKGNLKPKFIKKSFDLNKYIITSNTNLLNQNITNMLSDHSEASKPIIIKTDSWKPGVANVSTCIPSFFRPLTKTSLSSSKNVVHNLSKLNDNSLNVISSPDKKCDFRAKIVSTNLNKLFNSPKSYPLIAPKPCLSSPNMRPVTTTKPFIETLTASVTDNFTVIEPYVDDPTSPQKPKPILTVPVEVVSSPVKQNPVINSSIIDSVDVITNANNSEKLLKAEKSVFLNGGLKKIVTVPMKNKTNVSSDKKEIVQSKINQENLLKEVVPKMPIVSDVKDGSAEESDNVLKAKNIVLDAMQNVFSSTQTKKTPKKSVRPVKKATCDLTSSNSLLGSSSFSSILNDNILNGFSENDFEDVSLFEDDSFTDSAQEISPPSISVPKIVNGSAENSTVTPRNIKKARERKKYKRKKSSENSSKLDLTFSASECESEGKLEKDKKTAVSPDSNTKNIKSSIAVDKDFEKPINISVHSKNFNESVNKDFETKPVASSLLISSFESLISESQDNINKLESPEKVEQTEIPLSSFNETVHSVNSPVKKCKENNNLVKSETSTRTLRGRKCSSTEVKNFNNATKHNSHEKNSPEKNKIKNSINSKLKIQLKSPKNSAKNKFKKKSCKPEDIIQEINTITGGHSIPKRGSPKNKKVRLGKDIKNIDSSDINVENKSESNSSETLFSTLSICPLSKRRKTLKVCIKRSKRKTAMKCSNMPLNNNLTDVVDNANISNTVLESNLSLHSSFREAKGERMGTLQKEENSSVNNSSIPVCNMENSNEKLDEKEQIPADAPDLMVNSSETPLIEDASNNVNSNAKCTLPDNLVVANQGNTEELPNDFVNNDDSYVDDIKNSKNDTESCESLVKENNSAILSPLEIENSKDNVIFCSEENFLENDENLVKETISVDTEIAAHLSIEDSKDSSVDESSENNPESCESLIKENDSEVLPDLIGESSKDTTLPVEDSVEFENKNNDFSSLNDTNDVLNENLHNISDVTLNSPVHENTFAETGTTSEEVIVADTEMSVENVVFTDFVHEETVIEEVVTMEIDDDSELISDNPDVDICVDNEDDKSNLFPITNSTEEPVSDPNGTDIIMEESIINHSDVPSNDINVNENKTETGDTGHQLTEDLKTTVSLPVNSTLVEEQYFIVEDSNSTSSCLLSDIPENVSHELNEKSEDFSENVSHELNEKSEDFSENVSHELNEKSEDFSENVNLLLIKSNSEDKVAVSEEIADLIDTVSNNLASEDVDKEICDKISDNSVNNAVSLNLSCSDTASEKEIFTPEVNSTIEDKNSSCQINEASPNVSSVSNNTFEAKSDDLMINNMSSDNVSDSTHEKEVQSIKNNFQKNQISSSPEDKKCPKMKLLKKSDSNSPNSLKNWCVSDTNEKEVKSVTVEACETKSDNINSQSSDETSDLHVSSGLNDNSSINYSEKHKSDNDDSHAEGSQTSPKHELLSNDISNATLHEKTNNDSSSNFEANSPPSSDLLHDKNILTKTDEISSECEEEKRAAKKSNSEEISLPDKKTPPKNINECDSEIMPLVNQEKTTKALLSEKENIFDIVIKEEPMDIEESVASPNNSVLEEKPIKTEAVPNKRKRGRPRRSMEYCNTSLIFDDEVITPKLEEATTPVIPQIKEEDVKPEIEVKATPGAHSTGRKRKSNPVQASTPSSSRKKNYDPELVCVPFSMGWMREKVIRATGPTNNRMSDIYYFSPEGKKLRSMPEILTYLSKNSHIKLSAVNFTFAKELIYREPFEIERDAKQCPGKKPCASPVAKKTPSKAVKSLADSSSDTPPLVESKKKVTVKRKNSSLNESGLLDTSSNNSDIPRKSRQRSLTEYLSDSSNKTEDKSSRSGRKVVKKVPFDPSVPSTESQSAKKAKTSTVVTRHSTGNIKKESSIKKEPVERESLILKIPLKSPSSNVTKENKLQNSESTAEVKKTEASPKKSKKELSVNKPSNVPAKSSTPEKPAEASSSTESLLSRTNIKSPKIQNRLKVKLAGKGRTEL